MEQQYSLYWKNFHGNLSNGFAGLLSKGEFVDVTIAVDGHLLQAHKVILSICSPYFKKMLQTNPCQHPTVVLRDFTYKVIKYLLEYMYHGEVSIQREELLSFISAAEELQIKGLSNKEFEDEPRIEQESTKESNELQNDSNNKSHLTESLNALTERLLENKEINFLKPKQVIEQLHRLKYTKRKSKDLTHNNGYDTDSSMTVPKKTKHSKQNNETPLAFAECSSVRKHSYESNRNSYEDVERIVEPIDEDDVDISTDSSEKSYGVSKDLQQDPENFPVDNDGAVSLVLDGSFEEQKLPVRYKYIFSRKGHKQLVHMNFVYTKHSTSHGKTSWRCVQYFSLNRCPATIETVDTMICAMNHHHNHEDSYEKLSKNNIYEMNIESNQ